MCLIWWGGAHSFYTVQFVVLWHYNNPTNAASDDTVSTTTSSTAWASQNTIGGFWVTLHHNILLFKCLLMYQKLESTANENLDNLDSCWVSSLLPRRERCSQSWDEIYCSCSNTRSPIILFSGWICRLKSFKKYLLCPDIETTWAKALYLIGPGRGEEGSQGMKTWGR